MGDLPADPHRDGVINASYKWPNIFGFAVMDISGVCNGYFKLVLWADDLNQQPKGF